jgi:Ketosteroid isomerase homolog
MQSRQSKVTDASSDEQAIRELIGRWMIASEKGDLPTMRNLLADDVIFMVPNKEPFGKQAFSQSYEQMKGTKIKNRERHSGNQDHWQLGLDAQFSESEVHGLGWRVVNTLRLCAHDLKQKP